MDRSLQETFHKRIEAEPFARKLAIRLVEIKAGYARVEMRVTQDLENIHGTVHGGAVFSLVDEAFQLASNSHGTTAVALNMIISYHAPARLGSLLTAEAVEYHRTSRTGHYDIRVNDDHGTLIATCRALAYRKSEPLPFLNALKKDAGEGVP